MLRNFIRTGTRVCELYETVCWTQCRLAGHSKWQNIRHIKGAKDAERSALFTKLARQMKAAIQEGGSSDIKLNTKLENIVEQARRVNMPQATIQSVIKSCEQDKSNSKTYFIEIKGPGSCIILCEIFTSNLHMTKQNISTQLRKHNCKYGDGGAKHLFEEKGVIEANPPAPSQSPEAALDAATNHAIEAGAEDVTLLDDGAVQFVCGATNLKGVVAGLQQFKYDIYSASLEFIPVQLVQLDENQTKLCSGLLEKLDGMSEVVRLYDNVAS